MEGNPSLEMRADNAVRQLRRDGDIEDYLDSMENTLSVARRMLLQRMIPQERFNKFLDGYKETLEYFAEHREAPPLGYKPPHPIRNGNDPRKAKDIDLSDFGEEYEG